MNTTQLFILIASLFFSILVMSSYFFCTIRTPRHPNSWLLSIVVSAFYGPCLAILALFFVLQILAQIPPTYLLFTSVFPGFLALITLFQKWKICKPGPQFSWYRLFIPTLWPPKADLSVQLTNHQIPVDFYFAANPKAPLIFFFFGGGFENNNHQQHPHFLKFLSVQGYHVASVGYRQLPQHPWPQSLIDVEDVMNLIMRQSPSPRLQPMKYFVMGRSAGGFLALSASRLQFLKPLTACLAIYPVTDLHTWSEEAISNAVLESKRRSLALVKGDTSAWSQISLTQNPLNSRLSYYVVSGDADPVVDYQQTLMLQKNLSQQGLKHRCLILRSETHGFDFHLGSFASQLWLKDMISFLDRSGIVSDL